MKSYIKQLKSEFHGYNLGSFKRDLLSGLTVAAVALPLALAFGLSSGATAQAGLITAIIAGIVIGALSGASYQISGPTGAMAVILLPLVAKFGLSAIFLAGFIAGGILIVAGVCNLGKVIQIIPAPVITGFTSGIAALIIIGQVDNIIANWWSVGVTISVVVFLFLYPKKFSKFVPSSLVALVLATLICVIAKIPVERIGDIPRNIFPDERLSIKSIFNLHLLKSVAVPAVSIAILCMIESLLCGEVGARMKHERFDTRQELIAQGVGNIAISFCGGVPATAAIARTSVNIKSGGKTRVASLIHALGLLISIVALAPVMSKIPLAVLAGILVVVAIRMNEWVMLKFMWNKKLLDAMSQFAVTMILTIVFDLTVAIIAGVIFACLWFIMQLTRDTKVDISNVDENKLGDKLDAKAKKRLSTVRVIYLTGPVFFSTVHQIDDKINAQKDTSDVILSMRGVSMIDTSGILEFHNLLENLTLKNCRLVLAGMQKTVQMRLEQSGFINKLGNNNVFWDAREAIKSTIAN